MAQQHALHVATDRNRAVAVYRARTDVDQTVAEISVGVVERQGFRDPQAGSIKKKNNGRKCGGADRASPAHLTDGRSGEQPGDLCLRIHIGKEPSASIRASVLVRGCG